MPASAPNSNDKSQVQSTQLDAPPSPYTAPQVLLPKGGGAIRGIGEKFAANPVTGTGSISVPIPTSPGRSGFGPHLSLTYDSGSGNSSFGIGWNLALPSITRKTEKGLPRYCDAEESDVFILSGAEDLVPVFKRNADSSLVRDGQGVPQYQEENRDGYSVRQYRPRIEGLFARIERWVRVSDGDTHWRSLSKDNVLTVYGGTLESRVADPSDLSHVFSWLICQSYDDKGNAIAYFYVGENGDRIDLSQRNEKNRLRTANRYLKYVRYGNRQPLLINPAVASFRNLHVPAPDLSTADWMFELVFDFGEGHYLEAAPDENGRVFAMVSLKPFANSKWPARLDPFSVYRSGFEVRTHRLCRRVLMLHHFRDELAVDDYLVRSTDLFYDEKTNGSFISQVVQSGFKRMASPSPRYLKRSLPPLDFAYSVSPFDDLTYDQLPFEEIAASSLENLPLGIDGSTWRLVDLDGEGISGFLTEDLGAWFYKPNLGEGQFGPIESVPTRPSFAALKGGRQQLMDLGGDGNLDLVELGSSTAGFFPRTADGRWSKFHAFKTLPEIDWQEPNLRFVDLTGDGHADVLITEDQAFTSWHESYAEDGFGSARRVANSFDEEDGPRLVFADGTESIYLADMSGDGLSDLLRIRNGEVSYWPNLGYGRFGAKVTFDNAPWFDDPESFDQKRIHLADTDGSGPTDILYLGGAGVQVYLNQHGNSFSDARILTRLPIVDANTCITVADLLGRGTSCLVWSSPLPNEARRSLRFMDLMGGRKPHLLTVSRNNLGAEIRVEYASSTQFYLADKAIGKPWVSRLPFPVHVVAKVETLDLISGNRFITRYAYHHGYFDGIEREFHGFGRVDQWDTEEYGVADNNAGTPEATNVAAEFNVPPTLTKTWFHTGAYFAGERISRHFEDEYYREGDPADPASELTAAQLDTMLLPDTVLPPNLGTDELREAIRSLKGGILRQEIYGLDESSQSGRPYSVSERNYTIELIQPQETNRHSVFFTHSRETVNFQYERKLFPVSAGKVVDPVENSSATYQADPRVTHTVTLSVDEYGNVLQSLAIAYGRRFDDSDPVLSNADRQKQKQPLATLTEATFTVAKTSPNAFRAPLPAEVKTYELVKLALPAPSSQATSLARFADLVLAVAVAGDGIHDIPYEDVEGAGATSAGPYRRLIGQVRTLYRSNDLTRLLPIKSLEVLALPGETYKLAFTPGLLNVYQRSRPGQSVETLLPNPGDVLTADASNWSDRGGYVDLDGNENWWAPSGRVFFHANPEASVSSELTEAVSHFFLPRRFLDPLGHETTVDYAKDLLPATIQDALGNNTVAEFDYRVLQAKQVTDPNGNRSFAAFDTLGLAVANAVCGKTSEALGDSLDDFGDFDGDPTLPQLQAFVRDPATQAAGLLKSASGRVVYDFERFRRCGEPPFAASIQRETHASDSLPADGFRIRVSFVYSDGFERQLQSKIPAEPGDAAMRGANAVLPSGDIGPGPLNLDGGGRVMLGAIDPRWVGKGRTLYNNKGKPVKQYEPFFSSTHLYEPERELTDTGVTPILFYDSMDRVIVTLQPNHTYEKVVFDAWQQTTWDVNDTCAPRNLQTGDPRNDPDIGGYVSEYFKTQAAAWQTWYTQRSGGALGADEKKAADRAAAHADTPSTTHFDALGRPFLTVARNRIVCENHPLDGKPDEEFRTRVELDILGNQRKLFDERKLPDATNLPLGALEQRVVMQYAHDMLGGQIHHLSMEAGERWTLNDVMGKPIRAWDSRGHNFTTKYDALRRPIEHYVRGTFSDPDPLKPNSDPRTFNRDILVDRIEYGESTADAEALNLRTRVYRHFDSAGVSTSARLDGGGNPIHAYDFKGNLLYATCQQVSDYKNVPDWNSNPQLESETFESSTKYDALNRPVQSVAPHSNLARSKRHVIQPVFNEANLLEKVNVWLERTSEPKTLLDPLSEAPSAVGVFNIDYDAKGQRLRIDYANGTNTLYDYDPLTFRLRQLSTRRNAASFPSDDPHLPVAGWPGQFVQNLHYVYDPSGNITHIQDDAQQTIYFKNKRVEPSNDYTYDAGYRLIQATGREHLGQGHASIAHSYNDGGRVGLETMDPAGRFAPTDGTAMGAYTEHYLYDAVGNFLQMQHRGTDPANTGWNRSYEYSETSLIEAGKQSNRISSTQVATESQFLPKRIYTIYTGTCSECPI